ncbi:MAG: O-antigen ligase family protein [Gammaproteobacteria bacterium]
MKTGAAAAQYAGRAADYTCGARLGGAIVVLAGAAVATAVAFDQALYMAIGIAGLLYMAIALRWPYAGLLFWILAFPLLDPTARLDLPSGVPDVTFNRVAVTMAALTLSMQAMLRTRRLLPIGPIERCMLVLVAIMSFDIYMRSASAGEDGLLFFDEFLTPFLLFEIFRNLVAGGADPRRALAALAVCSLYLAPHGAYQFITHSELPFWIEPPESVHSLVEEQGRARGPFTDSVSYGALGNVVLLATVFMFAWSRDGGRRFWYGALLAGAGATVFMCLTRSVWLGLTVALLVAAHIERPMRATVATLFVCAALAGTVAWFWPQEEMTAVEERATDYETVYIRIGLYNAALRMAAERPLLGYGRHAVDVFQRSRDRFVSDVGPVEAEYGTLAGPPHNAYLSNLLMYGVFGMMAYIALFVVMVRSFLALRRIRAPARPDAPAPASYATLMLSLTVVYISISMFTDVMAFNYFTNLFFMLAGGAEGLRHRFAAAAPLGSAGR